MTDVANDATKEVDPTAQADKIKQMLNGLTKFGDIINSHEGQKIAVLCARYQYRGVVAHVGEDFIVLANARSVEISGPSAKATPEREDDIGGFVIIKHDAIEIAYQPTWSQAPLSFEEENAELTSNETTTSSEVG
jgi:hypothetical protein